MALKARLAEEKRNPPPSLESITDMSGAETKVGDLVCYWAAKSIESGKIVRIENQNSRYGTEKVARVKKGKIISPGKTSNQIFRIPDEKALLMMLQK